ncbi:pyridoxamine-phosphate oxidase [Naganishia albida]|nr:pyridoxamine-phosphate oxidase [Naganishia albida]
MDHVPCPPSKSGPQPPERSDAQAPAGNEVSANPENTKTQGDKIQVTSHNQYKTPRLLRENLSPSPLTQFQKWLGEAMNPPPAQVEASTGESIKLDAVHEPEAMTICTALPSGVPSARVVLLKQVDTKGFVFYTNYESRKSRELDANPYASIAFYWREQSRSVRVVGKAERVTRRESEEYFASRPRGSQIGAWASRQSEEVADEEQLARWVRETEERFEGMEVPCPPHWGGWRVVPFEVEFWSGQPSRLHDRFRYTRAEGANDSEPWRIKRLSP